MKKNKKIDDRLAFYEACGVDEVISPFTVDRCKKQKFPDQAEKVVGLQKTIQSEKPFKTIKEAMPAIAQHSDQKTLPQMAYEQAQKAKSLFELREVIESFDSCDLKKTALNTVFSDGVENSDIMIIGEAPGADEDRLGKPFVGRSGRLLDRILGEIGLSREKNCYITNVVFWRPPGNRTPTMGELAVCRPFVERHIELFKPKIMILVGGSSLKSMVKGTQGIMKMRGQWLEVGPLSTPTLAIYHPAFLLRSPGQKRYVWHDMLMLKDKLEALNILKKSE